MSINPEVFKEVHKYKLLNDAKKILEELKEDHQFWPQYEFEKRLEDSIEFSLSEIHKLSREK